MIEISEIYKNLSNERAKYFSLEVDQDNGTPNIIERTEKDSINFGVLKILEHEIVLPSESPFDMFLKYESLFEKTKEIITNELFGVEPNIEARINEESYMLISSKLTDIAYSTSKISSWYQEEDEQTYILIQSTSEEEEIFGYLGMLLFCRLEK